MRTSSRKKHSIFTQKVRPGFKRTLPEVEVTAVSDHFKSLCYVASGAPTDSWKLPLKKFEAYQRYREQYPELLIKMGELNLEKTTKK